MKLIDAIKHHGRPFEIPDCSRDDLPEFFRQMKYKTGAEIGVNEGQFSEKFAKTGLTIYAIDPWIQYNDYNDSDSQKRFDDIYNRAKKRLSIPNCHIIRKTSMEAVKDFEDESLDFVYIDGNHQLKYVIEDIVEWSKKVKKGGVISGHDYVHFIARSQLGICHVIEAVNAYTQAYKIDNWYLLGKKRAPSSEKRDKWRSWMWIKK
ncbi:class I SAM-dependent methyltransferase [Candidatus Roizmanbacteria bacterium]|nr:class I SAM-dependent methyltransferase [Candidatus Roizmanbacteria bacterium]